MVKVEIVDAIVNLGSKNEWIYVNIINDKTAECKPGVDYYYENNIDETSGLDYETSTTVTYKVTTDKVCDSAELFRALNKVVQYNGPLEDLELYYRK